MLLVPFSFCLTLAWAQLSKKAKKMMMDTKYTMGSYSYVGACSSAGLYGMAMVMMYGTSMVLDLRAVLEALADRFRPQKDPANSNWPRKRTYRKDLY